MACQFCIGKQRRVVKWACKKPDSWMCKKAQARLARLLKIEENDEAEGARNAARPLTTT